MKRLKILYYLVIFLNATLISGLGPLDLGVANGLTDPVGYKGEGLIVPTVKSQTVQNRSIFAAGDVSDISNELTVLVQPVAEQFPYLVLYVSVKDEKGNYIGGLTADDFSVSETLNDVDAAAEPESTICFTDLDRQPGISFSLVFDVSGSMDAMRLEDAKKAALAFIERCNTFDRGALVSFSKGGSEKIVFPIEWITPAAADETYDIRDAIEQLEAGGSTAVYDGIAKGLDSLALETAPRAIVLFSDGISNSDLLYDINEVVLRAKNEGVAVYTIGLGIDSEPLKDIAQATGGQYAFAPAASDMGALYLHAYDDFNGKLSNPYLLCYYSSRPESDGGPRKVTVTVQGAAGSADYVANCRPDILLDPPTMALSVQSNPANAALTISGSISDPDATRLNQSLSATLCYGKKADGTDFDHQTLSLTDNGFGEFGFQTTIPAAVIQAPGIHYYIQATDGLDDVYSYEATNPYSHFIPVLDNHAPAIGSSPLLSADPADDQTISFEVQIAEPDEDQAIDTVTLYYQRHTPYLDSPYKTVQMTAGGQLDYIADIPATALGKLGLSYFLSITDSSLNRTDGDLSIIAADPEGAYETYRRPHFSVGNDLSVDEGSMVPLPFGFVSASETDGSVSARWIQLNGGPVTVTSTADDAVAFLAPAINNGSPTALTFQYALVDTFCIQTADRLNIIVNDTAPQGAFLWSPENPATGQTVAFNDRSMAAFDAIVSWQWAVGGQEISQSQDTTYIFDRVGIYPVTLTVTDADGSIATVTQSITIRTIPPVPVAGEDQTVNEGVTVELDATGSSDPDSEDSLVYFWEQTEGVTVTLSDTSAARPFFVAPFVKAPGESLSFRLTVTDSEGGQATDSVAIYIKDVAPQVGFSWSPSSPVLDESVSFYDASSATADSISSYHWRFGKFGESTERNPVFAFSESGTFQVALTVVDANGTAAESSQSIVVDECHGNCEADGGCFISSVCYGMTGARLGHNPEAVHFKWLVFLGGLLAGLTFLPQSARIWLMLAGLAFFIILPEAALSQEKGREASISALAGGHMFDEEQNIDKGIIAGLGLNYRFTDHIGLELMGKVGRSAFHFYDSAVCHCREDDLNAYFLQLDGHYYFTPYKKWVPYVAAGIGYSMIDYEQFESDQAAIAEYGGGLLYSVTDRISLRGDLRHSIDLENAFNNLTCMVGITFQFGSTDIKAQELAIQRLEPFEREALPEIKTPVYVATQIVSAETEEPVPEAYSSPSASGMPLQVTVGFSLNQADIGESQYPLLQQWADFLKAREDLKAVIEGHTCSLGSSAYNLKLSVRRAENVWHYLVNRLGVPAERISYMGFGEAHPLNRNRNEAERRLNRRVQIRRASR